MRLQHILQEAKGVFGRQEGDKFVNSNGQEAEFIRVDIYIDIDIDMNIYIYIYIYMYNYIEVYT